MFVNYSVFYYCRGCPFISSAERPINCLFSSCYGLQFRCSSGFYLMGLFSGHHSRILTVTFKGYIRWVFLPPSKFCLCNACMSNDTIDIHIFDYCPFDLLAWFFLTLWMLSLFDPRTQSEWSVVCFWNYVIRCTFLTWCGFSDWSFVLMVVGKRLCRFTTFVALVGKTTL